MISCLSCSPIRIFVSSAVAIAAGVYPCIHTVAAAPPSTDNKQSDAPPDVIIELLEQGAGGNGALTTPSGSAQDSPVQPTLQAPRTARTKWLQKGATVPLQTPPSAAEAVSDTAGGAATLNTIGEAPGKMLLNGQNISRFSVSFGALDLSAFFPPQTALRFIPIDATAGVSLFSGDAGFDNPANSFYPRLVFEPCMGTRCFSKGRQVATGLKVASGKTWGASASLGHTSLDQKNSKQSSKTKEHFAPHSLFLHVASEQSAGQFRVRSDGNTPLTPHDDRVITLRDNSSSITHAVLTAKLSAPLQSRTSTGPRDRPQASSRFLWDMTFWTFDQHHKLGGLAAVAPGFDQESTPGIWRKFQAAQLSGRGLDPSTGLRTQAHFAGGYLDERATRSRIDPGNPLVTSQTWSLQSELQLKVPGATSVFGLSPLSHGFALSLAHRLTVLSRRLETTANPGSVRSQETNRQLLIPAVGAYARIYETTSSRLQWGVGVTLPMAWQASDSRCANTPTALCPDQQKALVTTRPSLQTRIDLQWSQFAAQIFAGTQSRLPDTTERFGSSAGVIPNPKLEPESRLMSGLAVGFGSAFGLTYTYSAEDRLIAPQQGTGSVLIFTNQEDIERHHLTLEARLPVNRVFLAQSRYDGTRAWYRSRPDRSLPGQPTHVISASLSTRPLSIWPGPTYRAAVISGCSANWQSSYPLDRENLIDFTPRFRLNPSARLNFEAPGGLLLVARAEASFLLPDAGASEGTALGEAGNVTHEGVEGLLVPSETYTLSIRGEF